MTHTVDLPIAPSQRRHAVAQTAYAQDAAQTAAVLGARLDAAEQAARAGRLDVARGLCANAILYHQPLLAGSERLLRQAVAALLYSQAFGQLTRLLGAVQGRQVRFRAGRMAIGATTAVAPVEAEEPEMYVLDPTLIAAEDGDRLVSHWAAILAAEPDRGDMGRAPVPRTPGGT